MLLSQQFLIFQRTALHSTSRTSIHCLVFESEGITMIQNVGSCEETFPLGLHGPADEDNTILHGYLPTDIALYTGRPESFFKGGGGVLSYAITLCNATIRQVAGHCIYEESCGCSTKSTTTMRYLHIGRTEVLIGTHKVWRGPAE